MAANVDDSSSLKILGLNISGLRRKTHNLSLLIIKYKPDFILLQETNINNSFLESKVIESLKLDPNTCFFNYNIKKSNGTCILQTSDKWKITFVKFYQDGRTIVTKIKKAKENKTLINIYAPTNPFQRINYYDDLFKILSKHKSDDCVLAGDFFMASASTQLAELENQTVVNQISKGIAEMSTGRAFENVEGIDGWLQVTMLSHVQLLRKAIWSRNRVYSFFGITGNFQGI